MFEYVTNNELDFIFRFVAKRYGRQEEVPVYRDDIEGIAELLGVLERSQWDVYYSTLLDKATYLLIAINKGHFFSNGNKRLALVVMTAFLVLNDKNLKNNSKKEYRSLLESIFPQYKDYTDFPDFTSTDFATYNLSIIIADSTNTEYQIEYEVLKSGVQNFLSQSIETDILQL